MTERILNFTQYETMKLDLSIMFGCSVHNIEYMFKCVFSYGYFDILLMFDKDLTKQT